MKYEQPKKMNKWHLCGTAFQFHFVAVWFQLRYNYCIQNIKQSSNSASIYTLQHTLDVKSGMIENQIHHV